MCQNQSRGDAREHVPAGASGQGAYITGEAQTTVNARVNRLPRMRMRAGRRFSSRSSIQRMFRLYTLGELRLETQDGQPVSQRRMPLILLAYLARRVPRAVPRPELVALLWGERPEAKARQSLRQALLELHRVLGDQLVLTRDAVRLLPGAVALDLAEFERDVDAGRNRGAIDRWSNDFLAGADDRADPALRSWVESERAGLRRRLALACERLLDDAERRGANREAIAVGRRWAELAPLDEHACGRLIQALRRDGRSAEAMACHGRFVVRLAEELELEPSRDFLRIGRSLADSAQLDRVRDPDSGLLPAHALPLVGRSEAFAALTAAWDARTGAAATIVVLEADPGMGSDRLCEEYAIWCRDRSSDAIVLDAAYGRPVGGARARPYGSASALLDQLTSAPAMGGLSPERLRQLAFLLPRLRERFTHLSAPGELPSLADLATAVREALEAMAEDGALLVILGRLASMDAESHALLAQVASGVQAAAVFVAVIADDDDQRRALRQALGRDPSVVVPPLAPLTIGDVAALVESAARLKDEDRNAVAAILYEDSAGIPRFVAPAIEELVDEGLLTNVGVANARLADRLRERALPVPPRVRAALRERLRGLGGEESLLLEACAVLGVASRARDVERTAGLPAAESAAAIESLVRGGWLRRVIPTGTLEIAPPMVRRALYSLIPPLRREALHAAAATALASERRWRPSRAARARVALHREQSGAPPAAAARFLRRAILAGAAIVATVVVLLIWRRPAVPQRPESNVAVFPFAVSGGTRFDFLRAGMVDLLSTSLDGAAGLHTVDPRVVIATTTASGTHGPLTPRQALALARQLGVSHFVLGTVVGVGNRLQTNAMLYHVRDGERPAARASAEGDEAGLFDIVDRLTAQLAVTQSTASDERLTQLAAVTTSSLPALKAYLAGRSAYRANDLYLALSSYQQAVAADSSFALAWYGLASTASWMMQPDIERHAAAEAVRHDMRLSARDRVLVEAFDAYSRGAADSAEKLATTITQTYDDIEGWVLLGEVLYHHNWKRGRSLVESRPAWKRVLALDSAYWPALQHLAEVAAIDGRTAEADSLLARYERSVGTAHMMVASRAMRAYAYGDAESRASIEPELATDRGFWLTLSVWYVAVPGRDQDDARRLAQFLVAPTRPPEQRGFGHVLLGHLALARGQRREARTQFAVARTQTPVDALEYELLLDLAPFAPTGADELARTWAELARRPAAAVNNSMAMSWPHTQGALRGIVRGYLAGMVAARTGDEPARANALATLAAIPDPTGPVGLAEGFAFSIRAEHERARHRPDAALALLERGARATPFAVAWTSGFVSQAYERYLRAELLHELHRDDEALRWYGTFAENSPYDLVYLAPSLYRQAQIYDGRGEKALAAERYARFLALWKNSDSDFAPLMADARARLALQR